LSCAQAAGYCNGRAAETYSNQQDVPAYHSESKHFTIESTGTTLHASKRVGLQVNADKAKQMFMFRHQNAEKIVL
jgi:hypothetical protein